MAYHTIYYNQAGDPYIIEKNFGYSPDSEAGSSHWTWHITARGTAYLTRGPFGKEQPMPRFVNEDQLEDMKAFNMLRRSDGSLINDSTLYPGRRKTHTERQTATPPTTGTTSRPKYAPKPAPQTRVYNGKDARSIPVKKPAKRGFWSRLKSFLTGK